MVHWSNRPLQKYAVDVQYAVKFNLEQASKEEMDLTEEMKNEFKIIGKNPLNMIVSVEGLQGSGKSWSVYDLIQKQHYLSGLDLDVENVDYSIADKVKNVQKTKKRVIHILDEQVEFFGMGAEAIKAMLRNIEKVIRKYKQCFWFLSPEHINHNCYVYLKTHEWGSETIWDMVNKPLRDQWEYNKLIVYDSNYYPFGNVITGKPDDMSFLKECEKKKDEFLDKLLEGTIGNPDQFVREQAVTLFEDKEFIKRFEMAGRTRSKNFVVSEKMGGMFTIEQKKTVCDILQDWILEGSMTF